MSKLPICRIFKDYFLKNANYFYYDTIFLLSQVLREACDLTYVDH